MKLVRYLLTSLFLLSCAAYGAQFTLTWTDNSTNELGFKIERAPGTLGPDSEFEEIGSVGVNVKTYVDAGLPNSTGFRYRVRAWNNAGDSGYSNIASGITPPPEVEEQAPDSPGGLGAEPNRVPEKLVNLSTRVPATEDPDAPVIAGFVLVRSSKVLLRGVGPELARFNVEDPMSDPQIKLFSGTVQIAENDNWSGLEVAAAAVAAKAFTLTVGSKDAAMVVTLPAGSYTMHLSGVSGSTGSALVEIYSLP